MEAVRQKMQDIAEEKRKLKMEIKAQKTTIANLNLQHDESQSTIKALLKEKENGDNYKTALDKARDEKEEDAREILRLKVCLSNQQSNRKSLNEKNEKLRQSWTKIRQQYFEIGRDLHSASPQPQQNGVGDDDTYENNLISAHPVKVEENWHGLSSIDDSEYFPCAVCSKPFHLSVYVGHWERCDEDTKSNSYKRKLRKRIGETMPQPGTKRVLKSEESQANQVDVTGHSAGIGEGEGVGGGGNPAGVTVTTVSEEPRPSGSRYWLRTRGWTKHETDKMQSGRNW